MSEPAWGHLFDDMFEGVQIVDPEFRYLYVNHAAAAHGRRTREELIGRTLMEMYPGIDRTPVFEILQRCMSDRKPRHMVNRFTYPDGGTGWFDLRITPVPLGILILSVDITDQKSIEEELRRSREALETILACMAEGVVTTDPQGRVTRVNPAAEALTGWPESEARGRPLEELVRFLNQATGAPVENPAQKIVTERLKIGLADSTVLVSRAGTKIPIASSGAPLRDARGGVRGVVLVLKDMSEEYALAESLNHAQKMEAVGRLAGGVAHDFNNLLTVILGNAALAMDRVTEADPIRGDIEEIIGAADRAAALTRQLLAFSRKQVLRPQPLDLNEVVERMNKLLRRLIGEDIHLFTRLAPNLHRVMCDPGQIEQIVMNLAVNARDAMPAGGRLTIETADVTLDEEYARSHSDARPGPHVLLAVSDTGTGVDPASLPRIFEPFFTTKPQGKGTGLGLSTVYGIVKQSGGNIWVYSEPGRGTSFKIYFPRVVEDSTLPESAPALSPRPSGNETILVVEDEDGVRGLIRRILEQHGYTVLVARDIDEALKNCAEHAGEIHLLLTDVVLPKAGGREVARKLLELRPSLKVAYMSGYTDTAIVQHGVLEPGTAFIQKPVSPDALLQRIRSFLAGGPQTA